MKVLIIDDSALMRKMVSRSLRQADIGSVETYEAANGVEGLDMFAKENPTLVLCDWNMPEMDGITFLRNLRKKSRVPVIMLTTEASRERRQEAIQSGASGYVTKPFTPDKLGASIRAVLAGAVEEA